MDSEQAEVGRVDGRKHNRFSAGQQIDDGNRRLFHPGQPGAAAVVTRWREHQDWHDHRRRTSTPSVPAISPLLMLPTRTKPHYLLGVPRPGDERSMVVPL